MTAKKKSIEKEVINDIESNKKNIEKDVNESSCCDEIKGLYQRALADYQNLLRRQAEEREKTIAYANENLILKILDVCEALEESQKHLKDEGIQKVLDKLKRILDEEQVIEINPIDGNFDPEFHEAIDKVIGPQSKIIKVHRKGYKLVNKLLRPAMVSVGNGDK